MHKKMIYKNAIKRYKGKNRPYHIYKDVARSIGLNGIVYFNVDLNKGLAFMSSTPKPGFVSRELEDNAHRKGANPNLFVLLVRDGGDPYQDFEMDNLRSFEMDLEWLG